ncbi:hypothetical protein GGI35DRAFT_432912 [Trichoderma velutinum]
MQRNTYGYWLAPIVAFMNLICVYSDICCMGLHGFLTYRGVNSKEMQTVGSISVRVLTLSRSRSQPTLLTTIELTFVPLCFRCSSL